MNMTAPRNPYISTQEWHYYDGKTPAEALRSLANALESRAKSTGFINDDMVITLDYNDSGDDFTVGACFRYRAGEMND